MHRSGTSATAGVLVNLGLAGPRPDDLVPGTKNNERGHWESREVIGINAHLLRLVDCNGYGPPEAVEHWDDVAGIGIVRERGRHWYERTYSGRSLVVKDPRICLTLPFWRDTLPTPMVSVLVLRDPMKVARSLSVRDGVPMSLGLALWDRYLRSAVEVGLKGMPTLVVEYDRMLADPTGNVVEMVAFLAQSGIEIPSDATDIAARSLDVSLRHHKDQADDYDDLGQVQRAVFAELSAMAGPHQTWEPPRSLPPAPLWVEDVIRLRRDYGAMRRELRLAHKSVAFRTAAAFGRVSGVLRRSGGGVARVPENEPSGV